jgi:hypothetical protein
MFGTQVYGTNISLSIDNGLKPTYTMQNSHDLTFLTPVTRLVSGTVDVVFDNLDDATYGYYTKMVNGTQGALSFTLAHPSNGGSVAITCPVISLSKYADDVKMDSVIISTLSFEAYLDLATNTTVSAVITNGVSTAY